ncbi:hypothetical protein CNR33_00032 [Pseudomonas phage tabernarius]|uniref:Uncharacterized protein n=1 Tax=Pseudomonas phage tabernarius TaxID=2048978 RepID=A0A2H4P6S8_9CAUD|nr:hypothetical protein FDJ17_gp32 [Pseudomonas phage tabernarius]ATW57878.1 hypothetical protein CNR33_00032 [Pseudomonas phage tabernarius]
MHLQAIGWMIAVLTCHGSEYNCDVSAYETPATVYESKADCEWSLSGKQAFGDADSRLECAEIKRPSN